MGHEIFLDGKRLKGTIPETFRNLTELRYILLSNNNIKGPLPYMNWETFPKLVHFDVSHNNITGTLPLSHLSKMPKLRYLSVHHNMLDEVCYHGGGFPELERLSMIYNRNMTGLLPQGLGELPALRRLEMHDTHLRGHGRVCSSCSSPGLAAYAARSRRSVPKRVFIAISRVGFCPRARRTGRGCMGGTTGLPLLFTSAPSQHRISNRSLFCVLLCGTPGAQKWHRRE